MTVRRGVPIEKDKRRIQSRRNDALAAARAFLVLSPIIHRRQVNETNFKIGGKKFRKKRDGTCQARNVGDNHCRAKRPAKCQDTRVGDAQERAARSGKVPALVETSLHQAASSWAVCTRPQQRSHLWRARALIWEASTPYVYLRTTVDDRVISAAREAYKDLPFQ